MPGPESKPENLRQRRNKKVSNDTLTVPEEPKIPEIPNPDGRKWHALTILWWQHVWESPMASRYLQTDLDALGMVALMVDQYYLKPDTKTLSEIRLQQARFGLSPWDRSRLEWRITKPEDKKKPVAPKRSDTSDPRKILRAVK